MLSLNGHAEKSALNCMLLNLQILYANEAESINPVEKDKEEQQTEVSNEF